VSILLAIIAIVVLLFLLLSGLAIAFFYFPRWLMRRYPLTAERKTIAYFALAGLFVSVAFTCKYAVTRTEMVTDAALLWPTVMILMDLDGHATVTAIILNFGLAILTNVGLYGWLGLLTAAVRKNLRNKNLEV
jgi:hypothetical protein